MSSLKQSNNTPSTTDELSSVKNGNVSQFESARIECLKRMMDDQLPVAVQSNFERLFGLVARGGTGVIQEDSIAPVGPLPHLDEIRANPEYAQRGEALLRDLVVVRLNGGLGTTMGLSGAKSLLQVKEGLSFNDLTAQQLKTLQREKGVVVPLMQMTSYSTDRDIVTEMGKYPELQLGALPSTFKQHRHPKLYADTLQPANESEAELNWNPPGHGDIFAALIATGILEQLLNLGKRYIFVANSDNLGATVEPAILGYMDAQGVPFLMETAERTPADAKGGHLARRISDGQLILRETAQAPTNEGGLIPEFGDITKYEHFNTNNLWLRIEAVERKAREHGDCIPLPLISNRKPVNPRDRSSRPAIQVETAMGAAIEVFDGAQAIRVPRERFAPVKSNGDLMVVRSDAYEVTNSGALRCVSNRSAPPAVSLDAKFFGLIADFNERVAVVPSLKEAVSFSVTGDVRFCGPVKIVGRVSIKVPEGQKLELGRNGLETYEDEELSINF